MQQTFTIRSPRECAEIGALVADALRIGFDITVETLYPETVTGGRVRQAVVTITEPPGVTARTAGPAARATAEENRTGLDATRAALRSIDDPDPDMTIAFVGERTAFAEAMAAHTADGIAAMERSFDPRARS